MNTVVECTIQYIWMYWGLGSIGHDCVTTVSIPEFSTTAQTLCRQGHMNTFWGNEILV